MTASSTTASPDSHVSGDPATGLVRRFVARPEFGPFVLLVVLLVVFTAINPDFMSLLNISNILTFTVELGLIAPGHDPAHDRGRIRPLGRVRLRLQRRGDVDAVQQRHHITRSRIPRGHRGRPVHRSRERAVRDSPQDPVVPGDAGHAPGRAGHVAVHHGRLPPAHVECQGELARRPAGGRLLRRRIPGLHVALLVPRRGHHLRLRADPYQDG